MSILNDIRREYPEFKGMNDRELSEVLRKKYYPNMPREEFQKQISTSTAFPESKYIPPPPPTQPVAAPVSAPAPQESDENYLITALKKYGPTFKQGLAQIVEDLPAIALAAPLSTGPATVGFGPLVQGLGKSLSESETYKGLTGEYVRGLRESAQKRLEELGPGQYGSPFEEPFGLRTLGSLSETLAESAPPVLTGLAAGLLTRSPVVAGTIMAAGTAPMTYGGIRESQKAAGIDNVQMAVIGTAVSSALDVLTGVGGKTLSAAEVAATRQLLEGGLKQAVIRTAKSGGEEAVTESLQNIVEQVAGGTNPATKDAVLNTLEAGLVGALGGTVYSGAGELATAPFRPRAKQPSARDVAASPEGVAEFQRLAREEIAAVMKANPGMSQNDAVNMVMEQAENLRLRAVANILGEEGAASVDTGMDVQRGSGAGAPADLGFRAPPAGAEELGAADTGRVGKPVPSVPVPDVGTRAGVPTLVEPTKEQVKATVPIIEQAFTDNSIDFEDAYGIKKLNAEQKKQAARIVIQSPEVDPYDAIGSVLERGQRLRGEKAAPKKAKTAVSPTSEPAIPDASQLIYLGRGADGEHIYEGPDRKLYRLPEKLEGTATLERNTDITPAPQEQIAPEEQVTPTVAETATVEKVAPAVPKISVSEARAVAKENGHDQDLFLAGVRDVRDDNELGYHEFARAYGYAQPGQKAKFTIEEQPADKPFAAYKAGVNWVKNRLAETPATSITPPTEEDLSPSFESIRGERPAAPTPRRAAPSAPAEAPKPSFLETMSPETRQLWQQSKERYAALGVTSSKQPGYEIPDYTHSLFQEGINSVNQGKTIPSRQQLEEAVGPYNADYFEAGVAAEQRKQLREIIDKAPGNTAAAKVMHIAQTAFEQMPKQDIIANTTPYDPAYETIRANPGMNVARMAGMVGWQIYGDPTNMGQVCIKEILQNSFDATRSAIANGQITQGNISVTVSSDRRTLTMKDNGIGMPPEVLGGKFLQIAGTNKEGDKNAGGFGIAKMLFLYANKDIRVVTARDGRISEMVTTGEQLSKALNPEEYPDAAPDIEIRDMEPADYAAFPDGHGTIIQLTLHEEISGGGKTFSVNKLPFDATSAEALVYSPLFTNINVTFNYGSYSSGEKVVPIGSNFPVQEYTQFVGVQFPWGVAKVYITRNQNGQIYGDNMHILSNGLWQFSTMVKKNPTDPYDYTPVPYRFYVDIVPSVKPDQYGYPFDFNRQDFTKEATADFNKVKDYIDAIYAYKSRSGEATSFGNIQYIDANGQLGPVIDLTPSIPVVDTAFTNVGEGDQITVGDDGSLLVNGQPMPALTADQLKTGIPSANELKINPDLIDPNAVMVHDNADVVIQSTGEKLSIPEFMRRQFGDRYDDLMRYTGETFLKLRNEVARVMGYSGLYDEAIGVSTDPEYRGVSIRLPFSGSFINPLVPVYADGLRAGYGIFGTMIHELAHHKVRNHYAAFPAEMQNILLNMEADEGFGYQRFKDNFADTIADKYGDIIQFGVEIFNGRDPDISVELRGNRFTEGSGEQVSEGTGDGGTGDVRGPSGAGSAGESLLGPAYESRRGAGKRGQPEGGEGSAAPITNEAVDKAVSVKLTKAQIRRLEEAAGIRRKELNNMQKRIVQSRNTEETLNLIGRLTKAARKPGEDVGIIASLTRSLPPAAYRVLLGFQQIETVFALARKAKIKALEQVDDLMRNGYIPYVNRIVMSAREIDEMWGDFASKNEAGNMALDDVIMISNMMNVDPSQARTAADYMLIDDDLRSLQWKLLQSKDPEEKSALKNQIGRRRADIQRVYFGGEQETDTGKKVEVAGWNDVPPEGRKIYTAARDFYRNNFNEHYRLIMQRIDDAKFDEDDAKRVKSSIEKMFAKARERVIYFPVKRFGEYWVSVGNDFYMRESLAEQEALIDRLKAEGETREITPGEGRENLRKLVANKDASGALKDILDLLDTGNTLDSNGKPKVGDMEDLRDLVFQMYLAALPEADMRRRFIHREFKTGFSTDALRTFASTAVASANQLGRLAYNYRFQAAIEAAKKETEGKRMKPWLDTLTNEVKSHVDGVMSPQQNDLLDAMIAFAGKLTFFNLLSAPSSAFMNLTQLHIVGLPVLSAEFGEAKTAAMASRYTASFLLGQEVPNPFRNEEGNLELQAPDFRFENSGYMRRLKESNPERYKQTLDAWNYAKEHEIIESTFSAGADLYTRSNVPTGDFTFRQAVRRGEVLTAAQRATANTINAMGFMFHNSEKIGRSIMYMSSFDLAYERAISQGKTSEQAGAEARDLAAKLTNKGMFDFSNWNKSRFAKSRLGRLPLQMQSYRQSMNMLLARSFVRMLPFMNKEGKLAAARVFFGVAGVTALYGGIRVTHISAMVLAAYAILKYVESLADDDDEEKEVDQGYLESGTIERNILKYADEHGDELAMKNVEYYMRSEWINQTFGKGSSLQSALNLSDETAAKLATVADMGLPALGGVDVSNSVALNDFWTPVEAKGNTPEVRALETLARYGLGPTANSLAQYVKAGQAWQDGNINVAFETMLPAIIRNRVKAERLESEGLRIGKNEDIVLKDPTYYTSAKSALISLGFRDAETSRNLQLDIAAGKIEDEVAAEQTKLLDRRYRAILDFEANPSKENEREWNRAERAIDIYNLNYPSNAISADTKEKSLKAKRREAADKAYGLGYDPDIPVRLPLVEQREAQLVDEEK